MKPTLELTKQLISQASITPDDAGCQQIIAERLKPLGFQLEHLRFGQVDNLFARFGEASPLLVFAGHTDVVPPGPIDAWYSEPFQPRIHQGLLYGRGATDMKSGLAAMIVAAENFIRQHNNFHGSIAFLITSDEEGPSIDGTQKVIEVLEKRHEKIDYCIVGEASSDQELGDQIRVGRRGSLNGKLTIKGIQGHVAYPHLANNPIHQCLPAIHALCQEPWDQGNEFFPPTTFQITNFHAGVGTTNVIPGHLEILLNFRFSTAVTVQELEERVRKILTKHRLDFELEFAVSGNPFLTRQGKLITAAQQAIQELTGLTAKLSTAGGTSDGRFIAPTGAEVIELGPCSGPAHKVNESVRVDDLEKLTGIYQRVLEKIFI